LHENISLFPVIQAFSKLSDRNHSADLSNYGKNFEVLKQEFD